MPDETPLEYMLARAFKADMVAYMMARPEAFEEAVQLALSNRQPYAWRAAWAVNTHMHPNDSRVQPFVPQIIKALETGNSSQKRELLNMLNKLTVGEEVETRLFDTCINLWTDPSHIASIRLYAFRLIAKMTKKYPELKQEVEILTGFPYLEGLSPVVRRSIFRMLK